MSPQEFTQLLEVKGIVEQAEEETEPDSERRIDFWGLPQGMN